MNNTAIYATSRLAELHRADVARDVAAHRFARRHRRSGEPTVTDVPSPRRSGWTRWVPAPRPAV